MKKGTKKVVIIGVLFAVGLGLLLAYRSTLKAQQPMQGVFFEIDEITADGFHVVAYSTEYGKQERYITKSSQDLSPVRMTPNMPDINFMVPRTNRDCSGGLSGASQATVEIHHSRNYSLVLGGCHYRNEKLPSVYGVSGEVKKSHSNVPVYFRGYGSDFYFKLADMGVLGFDIVFDTAFVNEPYCGNKVCDGSETWDSCIMDCGEKEIIRLEDQRLKLNPNELLAMESFAGGATISKTSMRYPVVQYAFLVPAIIIDADDNSISTSTQVYTQLDDGSVLQVPQRQTYSIFYVIENNYQLPTVCDAVNVDTGQCATIQAGIVTVCSEGQFDPSLGLCLVQGNSKIVCDVGRLDTAQGKCIWNPPLQAVCPSGSVFDPDDDKCYYYPDPKIVCDEGFTYEKSSGKCIKRPSMGVDCPSGSVYDPTEDKCFYYPPSEEICGSGYDYDPESKKCLTYPEEKINCPAGYAYDIETRKCVKYPVSIVICPDGTDFNQSSQKCEYKPPEAYVCILGYAYNPSTQKCERLIEDTEDICKDSTATYDPSKGLCIRNPPEDVVCERGSLSKDKTMCVYTPDTKPSCLRGIYDEEEDVCVYTPPESNDCVSPFEYNPDSELCEYSPTPTCVQGTYDSEKDACVYSPDLEYLCITGDAEEIDGEMQCVLRPQETIICKEGFAYNESIGMCAKYADIIDPPPEDDNLVLYGGGLATLLMLGYAVVRWLK